MEAISIKIEMSIWQDLIKYRNTGDEMLKIIYGLFCLCTTLSYGLHANAMQLEEINYYGEGAKWTEINISGETTVIAEFDNLNVRVVIRSHEVDIGKRDKNRRSDLLKSNRSSCTYARYPCSVVEFIDIYINNQKITVSRSVFADLADLNKARIILEKKKLFLIFDAADGHAGYFGKIEFNRKQVTRRALYSSGAMKRYALLEETIYHEVIYD